MRYSKWLILTQVDFFFWENMNASAQQPFPIPSVAANSLSPAFCSAKIILHLNSRTPVCSKNGHGANACFFAMCNARSPIAHISIAQHQPQWLHGCLTSGFRLSMWICCWLMLWIGCNFTPHPQSDVEDWLYVEYSIVEVANLVEVGLLSFLIAQLKPILTLMYLG